MRHSAGEIRPITAPTLVIWGGSDRFLGPTLAEPHHDATAGPWSSTTRSRIACNVDDYDAPFTPNRSSVLVEM